MARTNAIDDLVCDRIYNSLNAHLYSQDQTVIIAYSGGVDSHVLLHAVSRLRNTHPIKLQAYHVQHGLSPYADQWVEHCVDICANLSIPLEVFYAKLQKRKKKSLEESAREARYGFFRRAVSVHDLLLTAHTQDDQAETVLLNLLRGSGLEGVCAIHAYHPFGQGKLIRPMLQISRNEILAYAQKHQLVWVEDESNASLKFRRNLIRHTVLPVLEQVTPAVRKQLSNTARWVFESQQLLSNYLQEDYQTLVDQQGSLILSELSKHDFIKQKALMRVWLKQNACVMPSERKIDEMLRQMLSALDDKCPVVVWGDHELRRYRQKLYCRRVAPNACAVFGEKVIINPLIWDLQTTLCLPNSDVWHCKRQQGKGLLDQHKLTTGKLTVRFRTVGERILLPNQSHHTKVKHFLQDIQVPPWERDTVPLFFDKDICIAVGQYWISRSYQTQHANDNGLCFLKAQNND